jgi:hypothetical protein
MVSEKPYRIIERYVAERSALSDSAILRELEELAPLRDETDPIWRTSDYWRDEAYRFVALADLVAVRKLRDGVRLLLERACFGDPGEMMRGLRHSCEAAFNPDWTALAAAYAALAAAPRPGTRLWAIDQLTVLDDPGAEPVFWRALSNELQPVREIAAAGIERLERKKKDA